MKSRMRTEGEVWGEGDVPHEDGQDLLSHKIPWTFAVLSLETAYSMTSL